jgi:hypothetical protein
MLSVGRAVLAGHVSRDGFLCRCLDVSLAQSSGGLAGSLLSRHSYRVPGNDLPNLLALLTVVGTLVVIGLAWRTVGETKKASAEQRNIVGELKALVDSTQAAASQQARLAREAASRNAYWQREISLSRRRERIEQVGAVVEDLFWIVEPAERGVVVAPQEWNPYRNRIRHLLVGLKQDLPNCALLENDATTSSAYQHAKLGRGEIEAELQRTDSDLAKLRSAEG